MVDQTVPERWEGESEQEYSERLASLILEHARLGQEHNAFAAKCLDAAGGHSVWLIFRGYPNQSKVKDRGPFLVGFTRSKARADGYCKEQAKQKDPRHPEIFCEEVKEIGHAEDEEVIEIRRY